MSDNPIKAVRQRWCIEIVEVDGTEQYRIHDSYGEILCTCPDEHKADNIMDAMNRVFPFGDQPRLANQINKPKPGDKT